MAEGTKPTDAPAPDDAGTKETPPTKGPARDSRGLLYAALGIAVLALVVGFVGLVTALQVEVDPRVVKEAVNAAISDQGLVTRKEMAGVVAEVIASIPAPKVADAAAAETEAAESAAPEGTTPPVPTPEPTDNADPLARYRRK